jgi:hypothetical protein
MASPSSRATLADFCLRRLGAPVLEINVDPDQIEDCIDDCIQLFQEYHSDGTYRTFLQHLITEEDVINTYVPISSGVHYIKQILPYNTSSLSAGAGMFSVKYQIAMSDLGNGGAFFGDLQYYEQLGQYLNTMDMILTGVPITEYQRIGNRLHIFGEWWDNELDVGDYIVYEAYITFDPDDHVSLYNNIFIKNYTTALIKQRWGQNMSKFDNMTLPGGVVINGSKIMAEADQAIETLEQKLRIEYETPPDFFVG